MPSRHVAAALAVLAVVLAVGAGATLVAADDGPDRSEHKTITVAGSGEIDAEPDAAVVNLAVTAQGQDAASVGDEVANGAQELRETLADFGIPEDAVQTQRYTIHEHPESRNTPDETVYVGEQRFEVTLENVDQVGALIDAAIGGGADDVGGVHFTLSEERRDAIRDDAVRAAISDARDEASVIAAATGLEVTGVERASSQESSVRPYQADVGFESADAGTQIDPQDVSVSATVEVTFSATDA